MRILWRFITVSLSAQTQGSWEHVWLYWSPEVQVRAGHSPAVLPWVDRVLVCVVSITVKKNVLLLIKPVQSLHHVTALITHTGAQRTLIHNEAGLSLSQKHFTLTWAGVCVCGLFVLLMGEQQRGAVCPDSSINNLDVARREQREFTLWNVKHAASSQRVKALCRTHTHLLPAR